MFGAYHGTIIDLLQNLRCPCSTWHLSKSVFRDNNSGRRISEPYIKIGFRVMYQKVLTVVCMVNCHYSIE